jgi:bifunctional ADP-heptose synthase (sugar kinase/adenylyltransferase)
MDTRSKILTAAAALELEPRPLAVVTGYFDILRAGHARDLGQVRNHPLLVAVLPLAGELLPQRARAELVAALRVVDYVVIADDGDVERLVDGLRPVEFVRLEAADARRARQLIEHVHRRQTS